MANLGGVTLSSPPPPPRNDSFHISILRDGWLRCPPSWWHTTKKLIPPVLPFDVLVNKRPEKKFAFVLNWIFGDRDQI